MNNLNLREIAESLNDDLEGENAFYFIRHGQKEKMMGDPGLTELGRNQAEYTAKFLVDKEICRKYKTNGPEKTIDHENDRWFFQNNIMIIPDGFNRIFFQVGPQFFDNGFLCIFHLGLIKILEICGHPGLEQNKNDT